MDEQCCGQKTYEQLLEGFQSQIDSLRELEAAIAALSRQLQEAQGENERLKGELATKNVEIAHLKDDIERRQDQKERLMAWKKQSKTEIVRLREEITELNHFIDRRIVELEGEKNSLAGVVEDSQEREKRLQALLASSDIVRANACKSIERLKHQVDRLIDGGME